MFSEGGVPSATATKPWFCAPTESFDTDSYCSHIYTLGFCKLCSQDGLDSPARAMFESREEHEDNGRPASPQYLLPMEYTHADADAEVGHSNGLCVSHMP